MQYRGRLKAGPIDLDIFRGLLQNNEAISADPRLKVRSNKTERSKIGPMQRHNCRIIICAVSLQGHVIELRSLLTVNNQREVINLFSSLFKNVFWRFISLHILVSIT